MPTQTTAQSGDTLCGIAAAHGFADCLPLRALGDNSGLLDRPLRPGDIVAVPDIGAKQEDVAAQQTHNFQMTTVPVPSIRFVHGSPDKPFLEDDTSRVLNVSNYIADRAGTNGQQPFPTGFGFHADGHADPDTFKVEVTDTLAGGSIQIELESLKPVYAPDGSILRHEAFAPALGGASRRLTVDCNPVSAGRKTYRSRYLKLVADEQDQAGLATQSLLVTDTADGNGGDADAVEILDQVVSASYALPRCPVAAPNTCKVAAELPVGEEAEQLRIKLAFHIFRATPGGAVVGGLTSQMLRRRTFKWFRRAYAQAGMAPKLVAPQIEFLDPPSADMIVISQDHGRDTSGVDGGGAASTLTFRLGEPPPPGGAGQQAGDPTVTVNLTPGMSPTAVGTAIVAALPAGFSGTAFTNARAFNAANASCDTLLRRDDGKRLVVYAETTTDTRITVDVARVNINLVANASPFNSIIPSTIDFRRVLRAAAGTDDKLDCYVVGRFVSAGLRGRAFVPATDLGAAFQPPLGLRWAAVMGTTSTNGAVMDGSDNLPFTFPHEAGHVLNDAFHTDNADPLGPTELMSGTGTSPANAVGATKRICDEPLQVRYAKFNPVQATPGAFHTVALNATERMRAEGASVMEGW